MDYEKKYKEALERAKKYNDVYRDNSMMSYAKGALEEIFPELAESEDERIRKALIGELNTYFDKDTKIDGFSIDRIIAWLEKQYKQKPSQRMVSAEAKEALYGKPVWSEEDEENYQHACLAIRSAGLYAIEDKKVLEAWLKFLKERIQKGE